MTVSFMELIEGRCQGWDLWGEAESAERTEMHLATKGEMQRGARCTPTSLGFRGHIWMQMLVASMLHLFAGQLELVAAPPQASFPHL